MFRVKMLVVYLMLSAIRAFALAPELRELTVARIEHKLFPVLLLIDNDASVRSAIAKNTDATKFFLEKRAAQQRAVADCDVNATCLNSAFRLSPSDRTTILNILSDAYRQNSQVRIVADQLVCKSRAYPLYEGLGCAGAFVKAADDELTGVNNTVDIFGDGKASTRGTVDVPQYDVQSLAYRQTLSTLARNALEIPSPTKTCFQAELLFASYLLIANDSDFVAHFSNVNAADNNQAVNVGAHVGVEEVHLFRDSCAGTGTGTCGGARFARWSCPP